MTPTADDCGGVICEPTERWVFIANVFAVELPLQRPPVVQRNEKTRRSTTLHRNLRSLVDALGSVCAAAFRIPSGEGEISMCDYSLHSVASRPANIGERLVTTQFAKTATRGFASVHDAATAVCLQPGTELVFDNAPEYWRPFTRWLPRARPSKLASNVARFRQTNLDRGDTHHDALEFADGMTVLVTRLCPGQRATVLQLPADLRKTSQASERRMVESLASAS